MSPQLLLRAMVAILGVVWPASLLFGQAGGFSVKVEKLDPPKEVASEVAKVLSTQALRVLDKQGQVLCEIWLRETVPLAKPPAGDAARYRDLAETTLLGVIRWVQPGSDYRKQKIKPGVYTLRLAYQPEMAITWAQLRTRSSSCSRRTIWINLPQRSTVQKTCTISVPKQPAATTRRCFCFSRPNRWPSRKSEIMATAILFCTPVSRRSSTAKK
jgi:hypothetical protein